MDNMNMNDKTILDACCGGKMFWFDKYHPEVLFADIREEEHLLCDGRRYEIKPDVICDFRNMPFENEKFSLVVFDPPHMKKLSNNTWMAQKYGVLSLDWRTDLIQGFKECFRVLKQGGILIFKWNEAQISVTEIIALAEINPLFGHRSSKSGKTVWLCFLKKRIE